MGRKQKAQTAFEAPATGEWVDLPADDGEWVDVPADDWDAPPEMMTPRTAPGIVNNRAAPTRVPVSALRAAALGGAQGVTMGWGEEASAGLAALAEEVLPIEGVSDRDASLADRYRRLRDALRAENEQARADQPGAYMGGQAAGALVIGAPLGASALAAGPAGLLGMGAAEGAVAGAGYSDAEDAQSQFYDALEGAELGALTAGVGPALQATGRGVRQAAGATRRFADEQLARAVGPIPKRATEVPGGVARQGAQYRRRGIGDAVQGPEENLAQAQAAARESGPRVGTAARELTDTGATATLGRTDAEDAYAWLSRLGGNVPQVRPAIESLRKAILVAGDDADVTMPFADAHTVRKALDDIINENSEQPAQVAKQNLRQALSRSMMREAEAADPALAGNWRSSNLDYAVDSDAIAASQQQLRRNANYQPFGLRDMLAFTGAAGASDPIEAAIRDGAASFSGGGGSLLAGTTALLASRALRGKEHAILNRGAYRASQGGNLAANALDTSGRTASAALPTTVNLAASAYRRLADSALAAPLAGTEPPAARIRRRFERDPQSFGRYAPQIQEALQSDDDVELGALHFRLMATDPQYRQMYERSEQ